MQRKKIRTLWNTTPPTCEEICAKNNKANITNIIRLGRNLSRNISKIRSIKISTKIKVNSAVTTTPLNTEMADVFV